MGLAKQLEALAVCFKIGVVLYYYYYYVKINMLILLKKNLRGLAKQLEASTSASI